MWRSITKPVIAAPNLQSGARSPARKRFGMEVRMLHLNRSALEHAEKPEKKDGRANEGTGIPQDQALSFHRPFPVSLTAIQSTAPPQGVFYREDETPYVRLWMKNVCDVELAVDRGKYIFVEVERDVWELTLDLDAGYYDATLFVDGVEVLSPWLPIGYGGGHPRNFLEIGPPADYLERKAVPRGKLCHEYFLSAVTGREETCLVYLPPGYDASPAALPVLYLQHGYGENETSWVWQGRICTILENLLAERRAEPMVIVMADGMRVEGEESGLRHELYPDFLLRDLLPLIERSYRVRTDREGRAVAGLSMGSMQASMAAFGHPELFSWIGLFSGFLRNYIGVEEADGAHLREILHDPKGFADGNRLLFRSIGKQDIFFRFFLEEDRICSDYGIGCVRKVYEGGHDWNVWRRSAFDFLQLLFREEKRE